MLYNSCIGHGQPGKEEPYCDSSNRLELYSESPEKRVQNLAADWNEDDDRQRIDTAVDVRFVSSNIII